MRRMTLTRRQKATIFAALKHWQRTTLGGDRLEDETATDGYNTYPLDNDEIDLMMAEMEDTWKNEDF